MSYCKDEFYTLYNTIKEELDNYDQNLFNNKIIYCNCDSVKSNFYHYFNADNINYKLYQPYARILIQRKVE